MNIELFIGLILLAIWYFIHNDAKRLEKHIEVAKELMKKGMSEEEAMENSGCNHWDRPWFVRAFRKYPELIKAD